MVPTELVIKQKINVRFPTFGCRFIGITVRNLASTVTESALVLPTFSSGAANGILILFARKIRTLPAPVAF